MNRFLVNLCVVALRLSSTSAGYAIDWEATPIDGETLLDTSHLEGEPKYEMPASCTTDSFCFEKGDKDVYALIKTKIDEVLDRLPILPFNDSIGTSLTFRDNSDIIDPDCPHDDSFSDKPIYYIRDQKDQVRVVVQSPGRFQQIYSVKWCKRPGLITYDTPHFLEKSTLLNTYKIECVNTYMNFDVLVLAASEGEVQVEMARPKDGLPVCCKCRYTKPN